MTHGGVRKGAGRPPVADKAVPTSIRLKVSEQIRLRDLCAEHGVTQSDVMRIGMRHLERGKA